MRIFVGTRLVKGLINEMSAGQYISVSFSLIHQKLHHSAL